MVTEFSIKQSTKEFAFLQHFKITKITNKSVIKHIISRPSTLIITIYVYK